MNRQTCQSRINKKQVTMTFLMYSSRVCEADDRVRKERTVERIWVFGPVHRMVDRGTVNHSAPPTVHANSVANRCVQG